MNETIELYISVPKPKTSKEKYMIKALGLVFTYGYILVGLVVWLWYDWFYAVAFTLVAYLVLGIVISKLSQMHIPLTQWEHRYNGFEIAAWVLLDKPNSYETD